MIINRLLPIFHSAFVLRFCLSGTAVRVVSAIHRFLCLRVPCMLSEFSNRRRSTRLGADLTYRRSPRAGNNWSISTRPQPVSVKVSVKKGMDIHLDCPTLLPLLFLTKPTRPFALTTYPCNLNGDPVSCTTQRGSRFLFPSYCKENKKISPIAAHFLFGKITSLIRYDVTPRTTSRCGIARDCR